MNKTELKRLLLQVVDSECIVDGESKEAQLYLKEKRGKLTSCADYIVFPNNTKSVSDIIKICNLHNIKIVPQSGNTGLTGGSVSGHSSIILNTKNLNKILDINPKNYTMCVQSGLSLADVNKSLEPYKLVFPLSLASESTCRIGGNIASNAGGLSTIKYGSACDLVLGLEVVLPNGDIFSDLNILRKRNIGPKLINMFAASEGTLGFITAATLKLVPKTIKQLNILIGTYDIENCKSIFDKFYHKFYQQISSFEIFNNNSVKLVKFAYPDIYYPLKKNYLWNILITLDIFDDDSVFMNYLDKSIKTIMTLLKIDSYSLSYNDKLWDLRKKIPESQTKYGYSLKHDIAVPLDKIIDFIYTVTNKLENNYPNLLLPIIFGHMGDGNIHYNISSAYTNNTWNQHNIEIYEKEIKNMIIKIAMSMGGTFSAEHGIGLINKDYLNKYHKNSQVSLLKLIKTTLDKNNILNHKKIVDI